MLRISSIRGQNLVLLAVLCLSLPPATAIGEPASSAPFTLVPEMEAPEGIIARSKAERRHLQRSTGAEDALAQFEERVRTLWPAVREVDLVALSRFQIEETQGYRLPEDPGTFTGRALAWDDATGRWHLELRGPRLPARFDIVHRYLHLYATFDPASSEIDALVVTIRGWVLE